MKTTLALLVLGGLAAAGAPVSAQESAAQERQFIQGLRARGMSQLALEYLDRLKARRGLEPELALALPLEIAKTRMALAQERPLAERPAIYTQARAELEAFVKQHRDGPQAVRANLEIARIAALQGKAQFSQAVRQGSAAARAREAQKARTIFAAAGKQLAAAVKSLEAQLAKYQGATKDEDKEVRDSLERDRLQAEFDLGISLLLQAQTYVLDDTDTNREKRGQLAEEAEKVIGAVALRDDKDPLGYKARAWLIPCALATDQPDKADKAYKELYRIKLTDYTLDGKLLGDYFRLCLLLKGEPGKKKFEQIKREGQDWLRQKGLATFGNSPEGYGIWVQAGGDVCFVPSSPKDVRQAVRYEVARALYEEARAIKAKNSPRVKELCSQAQKLLDEVQKTESDLTPKARLLELDLFVAVRGGKIDPAKLTTFKEFYYLAKHETRQYYLDRPGRKTHLRNIALALTRALECADGSVPARDVLAARVELADAYLNMGDPHRAALLGEYLARHHPPGRETALAAAYALEAYTRIVAADDELRASAQGDEVLTDAAVGRVIDTDKRRFRDFARFVESQEAWRDEALPQYSRYQRALLALKEQNFPEAVSLLESIRPTWQGFPISQCQLVLSAIRLTKEDATRPEAGEVLGFRVHWPVPLTEAERAGYQKRALAALHKMPPLTARSGPTVIRLHFAAKLEECRLLHKEKKYADLEAFAGKLLKDFDAHAARLPEQVRDNLRLGLQTWANYAKVGQAELLYRQGNYDKVLEMTAPTVARIKGVVAKPVAGSVKDYLLVRDMLELAMRAHVQKNQAKDRAEAKQIFDLIQQVAANEELTGGPTGIKPTEILARLVVQLKEQVEDLRKEGKARRDDLKKTSANFAAFLDELTKDLNKLTARLEKMAAQGDKQALKRQVLGLLAGCYASLDKHKKAAALLQLIPPPQAKGGKKPTADEVREYLGTRLLYAQELRKDKQFKKAREVLQKTGLNVEAKQPLDMTVLALEAEKEKVHLTQDQGDYVAAVKQWDRYMKHPRLKGLLADKDFEGVLARFLAAEEKAMKQEVEKSPPDKKSVIESRYRDRERRVRANLAKMHKELLRLYFDSYYQKTYCIYQYAQKRTQADQREEYTQAAANFIKRLEAAKDREGWELSRHQFLALLEDEKPLRDKCPETYERLKKELR
jgi:hypothetical protein